MCETGFALILGLRIELDDSSEESNLLRNIFGGCNEMVSGFLRVFATSEQL